MRILVAGGTGFIGRALVEALTREPWEVVVLTRDPQSAQALLPQATKVARWDSQRLEGWSELIEGTHAVFNLAGATIGRRWSPQVKQQIRASRLQATQAILEAIQRAAKKPAVLIQASAVGYYGAHGDEEVTEETPAGNDFLARLAVEWEQAALAAEAVGVRVCRMRIGVVLDKEGGALSRMITPFQWFLGGPLGEGKQWFPWVHRQDVVGAMLFVMRREELRGAFNTTAPNPVTMREFARLLGRVLHRPSLFCVPAFVLRLFFGEMADALLSGQRAVPKRLLESGYEFKYPTAEEAVRAILAPR